MLLKIILIVILVAIAWYLYKRTQAVAKQELHKSSPSTQPSQTTSSADLLPKVEPSQPVTASTAKASQAAPSVDQVTETSETTAEQVNPVEVNDVDAKEADVTVPKVEAESPPLEPEPQKAATTDKAVADTPKDTQSHLLSLPTVKGDWASDSFAQLVNAANVANDPQSQHDALASVINHCYKMRKQNDYCQYGAKLELTYLDLFRAVYQQQVAHDGASDLKAPAFMQLSTLLNDTGQFEKAISVCQQAIEYQLTDGTVTGFEGRINRIEKAKAKAS
ncbi:hypothetical protein L2703_00180 [Shewanella basaltis]|uniref:hypothetical protein n=1 Tax=Shewanella basaltis TaxID=472183 RepID=UPI00200E5B7C|nr:hypothetical protein [Shewanella basaltis]MCL1112033.1 hypothetical protein [Shewanella basaltis]